MGSVCIRQGDVGERRILWWGMVVIAWIVDVTDWKNVAAKSHDCHVGEYHLCD